MEFNFCPECGTKTVPKNLGDHDNVPFCSICKRPWFPFSYACVIALVVDENDNFAFIKESRYNLPENLYVGVAGHLEVGDTFEEAIKREVFEEIGLVADSVEYIKSYYHAKRDQIMVGFAVRVKHSEFRLSSEVDAAKWFAEHEARAALPKEGIIGQLLEDYCELLLQD